MSPRYSIVIPTRNGGAGLVEVLDALDRQRAAPEFEIVVVDDGSTDDTLALLRARSGSRPLRCLELPPSGPAAARNRGVAAATGERVAFLGDDTVPVEEWLAGHDQGWRAYGGGDEIAVLGYTSWHPRMRTTAFLRYLNEEGLQFGYSLIDRPDDVPFNFFYTSNISLSRARLLADPFDVRFPYAAWEDIEAALRMTRAGLRIVYRPEARVLHDHPTDYDRFAARQERAGYCAVVFWQLHPELGSFVGVGPGGPPSLPSAARQRLREALVRSLQPFPLRMPRIWYEALRFHYVRGLERAWRERVLAAGGAR